MLSEAEVLEALRVCYDPELRVNIVDMGRVQSVHVAVDTEAPGNDRRVKVTVDLLPREEQQDAMLSALITNRLLGIYQISRTTVNLLEEPAWSPERMSDAARRELSKQRGLIQLGN
ncbi:metal-sulfur cluster assembly factor [Terriglobus aquaticus]|uniref:Metal-sulfur cluster assembly factor n=1 Tax=Terriglobus aquaticus TaxID=940139 RepID=A0ABW9KI19_9BACT|nr:iron-sulfur cluster assembly protein [Terriglobus aquaticus]